MISSFATQHLLLENEEILSHGMLLRHNEHRGQALGIDGNIEYL